MEEVRTVRANYLKQKSKVATQHGTQRHAYPNFERLRELILDGAIGELKTVHSWDSRQLPAARLSRGEGQPPAVPALRAVDRTVAVPSVQPAVFRRHRNGLNCLFWNMYRDFGVGQMGDMGAHTMDLVWNAIDAGAPTAIEMDQEVSDKYDPDICPVKLKASFDHPANSWRGPVHVGLVSGRTQADVAPELYGRVAGIANGAIFEGTKGTHRRRLHDAASIIPNNDDGDLTYYKRRDKDDAAAADRRHRAGHSGRPARGAAAAARRQAARRALPAGFTAMPSAEPGPNGFPVIQIVDGKVPAALGLPNTTVEADPGGREERPPTPRRRRIPARVARCLQRQEQQRRARHQQQDALRLRLLRLDDRADAAWAWWRTAPARSSSTTGATGRVTNSAEANEYLKRAYRPNWTLNG